MAAESWFQRQFSAEEKDSGTIVLERLEASRIGLDGLDAAVEAFGVRVSDTMAEP
ncbi:MAG: hypothetical protein U0936_12855 [Planctomycetaceae bacterium]